VLCLAGLLLACGGGGNGDGGTPTGGTPTGGTPTGGTPTGGTPTGGTPTGGTPTGGTPTGGTGQLAVVGGPLAFTPAGLLAIAVTNASCTVNSATSNTSAVGVIATSHSSSCSVVAENKANASTLLVVVTRSREDGQPASAVAPGTYTISATSPGPDQPAPFVAVLKTNATCDVDLASVLAGVATGGTVTLTSVSGTVAGSVSATLAGGGTVSGSFSLAPCSLAGVQACGVSGADPGPVTSGPCVP
jgi:hypothetical protein